MKEYPLIFRGPQVRAILDGRQTMDRRPDHPKYDKWFVGDVKISMIFHKE
jgi:hypothetical protein